MSEEATETIDLKEIPHLLQKIWESLGFTKGHALLENIETLRKIWHKTESIQGMLLRLQGTMNQNLFGENWNNGICSFCSLINKQSNNITSEMMENE